MGVSNLLLGMKMKMIVCVVVIMRVLMAGRIAGGGSLMMQLVSAEFGGANNVVPSLCRVDANFTQDGVGILRTLVDHNIS